MLINIFGIKLKKQMSEIVLLSSDCFMIELLDIEFPLTDLYLEHDVVL